MADIPDDKDPLKVKAGKARAAALSPGARSDMASRAAKKRWAADRPAQPTESADTSDEILVESNKELPIARWRGALNIVGINVPCYVLDNGQKIIGRTSATEVLTGIKGGGDLEKYIAVKALEPFINKDLILERFVPFRLLEVAGLDKAVKGLPHDLMIELCQGFVAALQATLSQSSPHPKLTERQQQMAMALSS